MTRTPTEYKNEALELLSNNWGEAIGIIFVMMLISGVAAFIPFGGLLSSGPLAMGLAIYFLNLSRKEPKDFNQLFDGFKKYFGNAILAGLLMGLAIGLGIILLIIPGIIVAITFSQTYRIMKDNPDISATDAMSQSHELMKGHKMDYFMLGLSFIGWALLCILTFGIGFIILAPYISTTTSLFYNDLVNYQNDELNELASHIE